MTRPNIDTPPDEPEPPTSMTSPPTPDIASPEPPKSTLEDVDYIRIATQHKGVKQQRHPDSRPVGQTCIRGHTGISTAGMHSLGMRGSRGSDRLGGVIGAESNG